MDNLLPVTQHELTKNDIDYSVKVSKQVIISNLNSEISALNKLITEQTRANEEKFEGETKTGNRANDLLVVMRKKLALELNNSSALNHLRLAINALTNSKIKINYELVHSEDLYEISRHAKHPESKLFKSMVEKQTFPCTYKIVSWLPDSKELETALGETYSDHVCNLMCFETDLPLPDYFISDLKEARQVNEIIKGNLLKRIKLEAKLENIDKTMEELEATLLVKHLAKSDHGKEVLAVTSEIVSDIIGGTSPLLAEFKE